jgi:hypothetical protein
MSNELISFRFQIGEAPYLYSDALVMTQAAYDVLTPEQITTLQQERYDRWYAIVTAPPEPEVVVEPEAIPTEENA